jgi:cytidylate kinase
MKEHTREEPHIMAAAERQMRAWSFLQEMAEGSAKSHRVDRPHGQLGNYITISREAGAGGSQIGEAVGRRLGWEVLDKNLLDHIAQRFHLSRPMLELVDETKSNWAYDILGPWLDRRVIPHEKYMGRVARIVIAAAQHGNVVLVGRGGRFLLPREGGLAVRIIASEKHRVGRIMAERSMSETQARQYVAAMDQGRRDFVARFFHQDVADPHLYDLVINVEFLGPDGAAEQIVAAWERLAAKQGAATSPVGAAATHGPSFPA